MNSNTDSSNSNGRSSHSVDSLPPLKKPQATRPSSFNPYRLSQAPAPNYAQDISKHPLDPARMSKSNSMFMGGQQPDFAQLTHRSNRTSMMIPPQHYYHTFSARDSKRATMQPYDYPGNGQPGSSPHRASRHSGMPRRPSAEPANLIHSIRQAPTGGTRPISMQVDSRRIVTGILQSALPASARPPPVDTAPRQSMPIAELQKRHKAALQKMQTHPNIQRPAKSSAPPQPPLDKPPKRPVMDRKSDSTPAALPQSKTAQKPFKPADKPSTIPKRRSIFAFWGSKDESKSGTPTDELAAPSSSSPIKKSKEVPKPPPTHDLESEEEEDVPLAQLRDRRASYNPSLATTAKRQSGTFVAPNSSVLTKSYSVPTVFNQPGDREALELAHHSADHSEDSNFSVENRSKRGSSFDLAGPPRSLIHPTASPSSSLHLANHLHRPRTWFEANLTPSPHEEKFGPRPLIFEDEAKAIRNSKRLWVQ